jgi:hypothetical protein
MYATDFGSTMVVTVGSALKACVDLEFTYSHAVALVVVLIFYKVKRASSSASDAVSASLIHPEKHQDHHHQPEKQRSRSASSDTEDESLLSISTDDDDSKSAVFEEEDFELEELVPEATAAERLRFLVAKKGNVIMAAKALKAYLQWRSDHQHTQKHGEPALFDMELYTDDHDWNDWNIAAAAACKARKETCRTPLPRIARLHQIEGKDIRDRRGFRALHIIPGQMDDGLVSLTTYATAVALYIDRKLVRESPDRISVLIDVRGGVGWRNTHVSKLLPFIQTTTKLLITMFPERLQQAVVYPLPPAFGWIWSVSKRCMDPLTADKICLLTGPATIVSPPPVDQMIKYLDERIVALLEKTRVAAFITSSSEDSTQQS